MSLTGLKITLYRLKFLFSDKNLFFHNNTVLLIPPVQAGDTRFKAPTAVKALNVELSVICQINHPVSALCQVEAMRYHDYCPMILLTKTFYKGE